MNIKAIPNEVRWLLEEKYGGKITDGFENDLKRLEAGEPLGYVIGFSNFLDTKIDLSSKPLIPRTETEYWVQQTIEEMKKRLGSGDALWCLDLFAGSGCIGVSVLTHLPNTYVDIAEFDPRLLTQIKKNLALNKIPSTRARVIHSDVFKNISGRYHYIFANPPYIAWQVRKQVQDSVMKYEPRRALFARENGLYYIKKLITQSPKFLYPKGILQIEFDARQKKAIDDLLHTSSSYASYYFAKDQYGKWRTVTLVRK